MTARAPRATVWVVGLLGLAAVGLTAVALGLPMDDSMQLVAIAGGAAIAAGLVGAALLHLLRGRSFAAQVSVVALTSTGAVVAGALAAGNAMFINTHDLSALAVVVAMSAVVGVVSGLLLGQRVGRASASLREAAARLTDDEPPPTVREGPGPIRELARLHQELDDMAAQLRSARERERAADAARRELVSWVSHDLRTPLAGIRAVTEALEDGLYSGDEVPDAYATIHRETDRLALLVDDLFELSKIHAGAVRLKKQPVELAGIVGEVVTAGRALAERHGVRLTAEAGTGSVTASPAELGRILRNLVGNALRETPAGGEVVIAAHREPDAAVFAVTDTCGGIPDDVLPRVFETAYRGDRARTATDTGGAGLGLAIARGLVDAHGGTIAVENVADGCRFEVRLPA